MPHVIIRSYSTYYDVSSDVQFSPVLDRKTGCYIGHAQVDKKTATEYAKKGNFEVLSDADFTALSTIPEPEEPEALKGDSPAAQAAGGAQPPAAPGAPVVPPASS